MIEVRGLKKHYKVKKKIGAFNYETTIVEAVKGIDLEIPKGKIIGLLGVNGAGKTTTAKMLSTLLRPTEGSIHMDGIPYESQIKSVKKRINMIAGGERMIYWRLTARENLMYYGQMYGLTGIDLKSRVTHLLQEVGLAEHADIPVEKFSKGMKQRLQIARGMINNPDYIFLDEPTLGLDVPIAKEMRQMFQHMAKKEEKGVLLTTHYMQEVEELCDYVYILADGRVVEEGSVIDLMGNYQVTSMEHVFLRLSEKVVGGVR